MAKSKVQIAPSLLSADLSNLGHDIEELDAAGADLLHFDVMDGHFVPNITFGFPVIQSVRKRTKLIFDAHLMIDDADKYLEDFKKAGCDWLSVHVEACPHLNRTLNRIRELGMKAGIAINPGTSLAHLDGALEDADYVLLMSVNPGFGGQKFLERTLDRLKQLKKRLANTNVKIQIDGGINKENIGRVVSSGAEIIVVGTGLFSFKNHKKAIRELRKEAEG